jgi:hypothetical protein
VAAIEKKNFDSPDETRPHEGKGKADIVEIAGQSVARITLEPGWKWSNNLKPIAKTDSCQVSHLGYVASGRLKVIMDDGSEEDYGPGDVYAIAPGHDAEVVGDQTCVAVDFGRVGDYAKRQ